MERLVLRFAQQPESSITTVLEAHEAVRLILQPAETETTAALKSITFPNRHRKHYARMPSIPLQTHKKSAISLDQALDRRYSIRAFEDGYWMKLEDLGSILHRAVSFTEDPDGQEHRPYPSAGGLYPAEIYVLAIRVDDLPAGLYYYDAPQHSLSTLLTQDVKHDFRIMICDDAINAPNIVFIITAAFFRSCLKYGGRGYRYALIEVGAIAQTLDLCCREAGLGAIWLGGFADEIARDFLDINWEMELEAPVLFLGVGKKKADNNI